MVNLKHVVLLRGSTRDAAKFKETVSILSQYVGTQLWSYLTVVATAMLNLKSPSRIVLLHPVMEFMVKGAKTLGRFDADGKANPSVLDNADYKLDIDLFVVASKMRLLETQSCKEKNVRVYNLVLKHCPKDLEAELRNHTKSDTTELTQDAISLLGIIRDVTLNLKESRQCTMNFVKCDVKLKTTAQNSNETNDKYYKVFSARKDTVNAHSGEDGHQKLMFEDRLAAILTNKRISRADFDRDRYDKANKKRIEAPARDESREEYLACLFLLM